MSDTVTAGERISSSAFDEWWNRRGQFIDPDTDDVSWEDKRRALAEAAFMAAMAQSMNYVSDDPIYPTKITFSNGSRVISKNGKFFLVKP